VPLDALSDMDPLEGARHALRVLRLASDVGEDARGEFVAGETRLDHACADIEDEVGGAHWGRGIDGEGMVRPSDGTRPWDEKNCC